MSNPSASNRDRVTAVSPGQGPGSAGAVPPESEAGSLDATGVGEYLATQRRLRGISIDDLCASTKIPRRNLERLESGAFDGRPDGFTRGFVRVVAEALGLDADEAVMRLAGEPSPDEFRSRALPGLGWWLRVAAVLGAIALLGLGGRMLFWWGTSAEAPSAPREAEVTYRNDAVRDLAATPTAPQPDPAAAAAFTAAAEAEASAASEEAAGEAPEPATAVAERSTPPAPEAATLPAVAPTPAGTVPAAPAP